MEMCQNRQGIRGSKVEKVGNNNCYKNRKTTKSVIRIFVHYSLSSLRSLCSKIFNKIVFLPHLLTLVTLLWFSVIFGSLGLVTFEYLFFQMGTQHHEPMVAMICPEKTGDKLGKLYHNQYMSSDGKWTTDFDHKATCRQDKVEILEYCKKVTP